MQCLYIIPTIFLAVVAQEQFDDTYPEWYTGELLRQRRDVTVEKKFDDGRLFGTLGQNDAGLFGKGGYEHKIFNDDRGQLNANAYGTRVLGPAGDSTHFGGGADWKNSNAAASFDISKQMHGGTSYQAAAGGSWPVGKNGDFSLQGTYGKQAGMSREYGGLAKFNYRF